MPTQLTRFLDPAADIRARVAHIISARGLDPECFPSLNRMTKEELENWAAALGYARDRVRVRHHAAKQVLTTAGR